MNLKDAQEILDPYGMVIMWDETLKMFKVFLAVGIIYISAEDMKALDVPNFKTVVAHGAIKDQIMNPQITLQ